MPMSAKPVGVWVEAMLWLPFVLPDGSILQLPKWGGPPPPVRGEPRKKWRGPLLSSLLRLLYHPDPLALVFPLVALNQFCFDALRRLTATWCWGLRVNDAADWAVLRVRRLCPEGSCSA